MHNNAETPYSLLIWLEGTGTVEELRRVVADSRTIIVGFAWSIPCESILCVCVSAHTLVNLCNSAEKTLPGLEV